MKNIKKNIHLYILFLLLIILSAIWYAVFIEGKENELTVAFLDVGQGDAIFIQAPSGNQMLIDGGTNKKVLEELSRVMPFYDRSIDVVLATHPDKDHTGGLPNVLSRFSVGTVFRSGAKSDSGTYTAFEEVIESTGVKEILARRGQVIWLGPETYVQILFPDRDVSEGDANVSSVVAKLVFRETSFLLTGDSPKAIERFLADTDGKNLNVDVLKVGHHGSKTSTSAVLLGAASPDSAVISAGCDNRYGHPHKEVTDLLAQFEVETFDTCSRGTIIFKSDGEQVELYN